MMQEAAEGKHCLPTSPYRDEFDALLAAIKAAEDFSREARSEARSDRMVAISERQSAMAASALAISNEALSAAREQARWAKWAAVAAVIALIISKANDMLKLIS